MKNNWKIIIDWNEFIPDSLIVWNEWLLSIYEKAFERSLKEGDNSEMKVLYEFIQAASKWEKKYLLEYLNFRSNLIFLFFLKTNPDVCQKLDDEAIDRLGLDIDEMIRSLSFHSIFEDSANFALNIKFPQVESAFVSLISEFSSWKINTNNIDSLISWLWIEYMRHDFIKSISRTWFLWFNWQEMEMKEILLSRLSDSVDKIRGFLFEFKISIIRNKVKKQAPK